LFFLFFFVACNSNDDDDDHHNSLLELINKLINSDLQSTTREERRRKKWEETSRKNKRSRWSYAWLDEHIKQVNNKKQNEFFCCEHKQLTLILVFVGRPHPFSFLLPDHYSLLIAMKSQVLTLLLLTIGVLLFQSTHQVSSEEENKNPDLKLLFCILLVSSPKTWINRIWCMKTNCFLSVRSLFEFSWPVLLSILALPISSMCLSKIFVIKH